MLKIIYCVDRNNGFSYKGKLPWSIKAEMSHFQKTTKNQTVLMGYNTYMSIGGLLPERTNIIFTRNRELQINDAIVTNQKQYIINKAINEDIYVIGGKEIINLFINEADEIIETVLKNEYTTDMSLYVDKSYFKMAKWKKNKDFTVFYYERV